MNNLTQKMGSVFFIHPVDFKTTSSSNKRLIKVALCHYKRTNIGNQIKYAVFLILIIWCPAEVATKKVTYIVKRNLFSNNYLAFSKTFMFLRRKKILCIRYLFSTKEAF